MGGTNAQLPIGRQVSLPGHFDLPVALKSARPLGKRFECRVRPHDGSLDEAIISEEEALPLAGASPAAVLATAKTAELLVADTQFRSIHTEMKLSWLE